MKKQQWRLILELLSGGPMPLCGGGLGAILSAPPEVSPLRPTQDIYRWCQGLSGYTAGLSWDHLIWLHEIIFLKYGVRKHEKSLIILQYQRTERRSPPPHWFLAAPWRCGLECASGGLEVIKGLLSTEPACPPTWPAAEPVMKPTAPQGTVSLL